MRQINKPRRYNKSGIAWTSIALKYLRANRGVKVTAAQIAETIGVDSTGKPSEFSVCSMSSTLSRLYVAGIICMLEERQEGKKIYYISL